MNRAFKDLFEMGFVIVLDDGIVVFSLWRIAKSEKCLGDRSVHELVKRHFRCLGEKVLGLYRPGPVSGLL